MLSVGENEQKLCFGSGDKQEKRKQAVGSHCRMTENNRRKFPQSRDSTLTNMLQQRSYFFFFSQVLMPNGR